MKTPLSILLLSGCLSLQPFLPLSAQDQPLQGKVSPQTADFVRYGNMPVSLYTGQVSVSVPLYHLQDPDFDLPLVLNYSADGLKPHKRSGWTGLNWSLGGTGVITREVYNAPDDYADYQYPGGVTYMGFWQAVQKRRYSPSLWYNFDPEAVVTRGNPAYYEIKPLNTGESYDSEPDFFLFSLPGCQGRFVIDNLDDVLCSEPGVKVDLSEMTAQHMGAAPKTSQIKLTLPDGYVYTFGSLEDNGASMEYSFSFHPNLAHNWQSNPASITAWHLTSITAPNGRTLKLSYEAFPGLSDNSSLIQSTAVRKQLQSTSNPAQFYENYDFTATKTVLLKSIEIEDTGVSIEFQSSKETCSTFYSYQKYNALGLKLDAVVVKQDGSPVYTWQLSYENKGHLRFLTQVEQPDGGSNHFGYTHPDGSYPRPQNIEVDEFGYCNDINGQPYSLLSRMDYPTGGYTTFQYVHHDFGKRVRTEVTNSSYQSSLMDCTGESSNTLNSFRIQKIYDYTSDDILAGMRSYSYKTSEGQLSPSSGILLKTRPVDATDSRNPVLLNSVWNRNYNIEEPYIGYSHVTENFPDGSFVRYRFSDYASCPDGGDVKFQWISNEARPTPMEMAFSHASLATSKWDKRGLLVEKETYDAQGELRLLQEYTYKGVEVNLIPTPPGTQSEGHYSTCFRSLSGGGMAMKIRVQEHPVVREKTSDYGDRDGCMYTLKDYAYNSDGLLSQMNESTSEGDTLTTTYMYPHSLNHPELLSRHIVNYVLGKRKLRNGTLLWTEGNEPKVLSNGGVVTDSTYLRKGYGIPVWQTRYPVYDNYGNPVDIREREGVNRIVIWGYAGRYPVAEITGANYIEVKKALGGTAPESLSSAATPDMARLDALREALPNALVTTYTYKPLVGVASVTDANGTTTNYTYNDKGELVRVSDDDGRTVTEYEKHYR